jgi:hypothetical protein
MGKLGLGSFGMALTVSDTYLDEAAELERLGYSGIWLPGGQIDSLGRLADLIGATTAVPVGSAIISLDISAGDGHRTPRTTGGNRARPSGVAPNEAAPCAWSRCCQRSVAGVSRLYHSWHRLVRSSGVSLRLPPGRQ